MTTVGYFAGDCCNFAATGPQREGALGLLLFWWLVRRASIKQTFECVVDRIGSGLLNPGFVPRILVGKRRVFVPSIRAEIHRARTRGASIKIVGVGHHLVDGDDLFQFVFWALVPNREVPQVTAVVTAIMGHVESSDDVDFIDQRSVHRVGVKHVGQLLLHPEVTPPNLVSRVEFDFLRQPPHVRQHAVVFHTAVKAGDGREIRGNVERDIGVGRCRNE